MAKALDIENQNRWEKCPDCHGIEWVTLFEGIVGDGKCKHCQATGLEPDPLQTIVYTIGGEKMKCEVCHGDTQCKTCGGSGRVLQKVAVYQGGNEEETSNIKAGDEEYVEDQHPASSYEYSSSDSAVYTSEPVRHRRSPLPGILTSVIIMIGLIFLGAHYWDSIAASLEDLFNGIVVVVLGGLIVMALFAGK